MGRPRDVEDDAVFATADALLKQRKRPSQKDIAEILGCNRNRSIETGLEKWWVSLSDRLDQAQELQELRAKVAALLHELSFCRVVPLPMQKPRLDALLNELRQKTRQ